MADGVNSQKKNKVHHIVFVFFRDLCNRCAIGFSGVAARFRNVDVELIIFVLFVYNWFDFDDFDFAVLNVRWICLLVVGADTNSSDVSGVAIGIINGGSIGDGALDDDDVCVVHFSMLV